MGPESPFGTEYKTDRMDKDYNEISNTATNLGWAHVTKDGFLIVGTKRLGNMKNKNRTLNKFYTYVAKQVLKR